MPAGSIRNVCLGQAHRENFGLKDGPRGRLTNWQPLCGASLASVLVGSTGAFQVFASSGNGALLVYMPLLIACWLIAVQLVSPIEFPKYPWTEILPLALLCLAPILSTLWSAAPQKTITDAATLLILGLLAIAISKYLDFDQRMRIIGQTLAALIVLSLLVVIISPTYGLDVDSRGVAWRGIFSNKNSLGRVAAIELFVSIFLFLRTARVQRMFWLIVALVSLYVLINSGSQTALVAALVGVASVALSSLYKVLPHRAVPVATILIGGYVGLSALVPLIGPRIAGFVSRDPTLTGRTTLWNLANVFADQKPILGWGFGAVWQLDGGVGQTISRSLSFQPGSAHNGIIDLRLQLGIFGVLLFAIGLWVLLLQALGNETSSYRNSWKLGYMTLFLTMDLTESAFYFGMTWFLGWVLLSGERNRVGFIR